MINIDLLFFIIALSSFGWLWIYSTPTLLLKNALKSKIKLLNNNYVSELMDCLTCSTFWITLIGLLILTYPIYISIFGGAIASVFITLIDSYIKFKI